MTDQTNPPLVRRTPLRDAIAIIDELPCRLPGLERVALEICTGRVSPVAVPLQCPGRRQQRALADGFALAGLETVGASPYNPLTFRLLGSASPATPFSGSLAPNTAVRIAMGAALPTGADAVLAPEAAQQHGDHIEVFDATGPGAGTDVGAAHWSDSESKPYPGQRSLRAFDLALLAARGVLEPSVHCQPRVRILVTSTQPGAVDAPTATASPSIDATSPMVCALVERDGGLVEECIRLDGDAGRLREHLQRPGVDLILTTGGTGRGFNDHTVAITSQLGSLLFHGVSLMPGESVAAASLPSAPAIHLPGHPVAAASAYECLAARLVRRLAGRAPDWPNPPCRVRLARKVSSSLGVTDWCRIRFLDAETAEPLALSGPPSLEQLARAEGFFLIPPESEGYPAGSIVEIHVYH